MSEPAQSKQEAKAHADAIQRAAEFFRTAAKNGELPMTAPEFAARVKAFYAELENRLSLNNALMLAAWEDRPVPQSCFAAWASASVIWAWRNLPADQEPLEAEVLNGKVCIRPSRFFAALMKHGKAQ